MTAKFYKRNSYLRTTFMIVQEKTGESMNPIPKISEAEWEVMKVIWQEHPATAEQIIERLPADIE